MEKLRFIGILAYPKILFVNLILRYLVLNNGQGLAPPSQVLVKSANFLFVLRLPEEISNKKKYRDRGERDAASAPEIHIFFP